MGLCGIMIGCGGNLFRGTVWLRPFCVVTRGGGTSMGMRPSCLSGSSRHACLAVDWGDVPAMWCDWS